MKELQRVPLLWVISLIAAGFGLLMNDNDITKEKHDEHTLPAACAI